MAQFNSYTNVSSLNSTDEILVWQGGAVKAAEISDVESFVATASRWTEIDSSKYTSTPAGPLQISMSDTSDMETGRPIRLTQSGSLTYGIISAVTANTSIDIRGWNLNGVAITKMELGKPEQIFELFFNVSGGYGNTLRTDLLGGIMGTGYRWRGPSAKMVQLSVFNEVADGSSAPVINALINGSRTVQDGSPTGVAVTGNKTWNDSNYIDSATGSITRDQPVELECTSVAGAGSALNLSASLTFILV